MAGTDLHELTTAHKRWLTLYKWRYMLESHGFTREEAARLVFLKWLHARSSSPAHRSLGRSSL